jgi:hypothetical protein
MSSETTPTAAHGAQAATAPAEKPFNADNLMQSTARYTQRAWYLFLKHYQDLDWLQTAKVRISLTARSAEGAQELKKLLSEQASVDGIQVKDKVLTFVGSFAAVQTVIKHAQFYKFDAETIA